MKNLVIFVIIIFCLIQANEGLFNKISHSNIVFASSTNSREDNIPIIDRSIPFNIETATFAMGCFWGPDGLFGVLPGVIRTRVGYAGGEKINPTYHDLGDHSETIQIDYDPEKITYPQLLQIFWDNHNCKLKSSSRQYMSIVFYHNVKQRDEATQSMQEQEKKLDTKLVTEIISLTNFYLAEDYHQKYRLQQIEELSGELKKIYPNFQDFVDSTAVARMNGFIGGNGTCEQLKKEISTYGLTEAPEKYLLNLVCQSIQD